MWIIQIKIYILIHYSSMPFPPLWLMFPTLTSFKLHLFRLMVKLYICFKLLQILLLFLTIIIQLPFNYAALDIHLFIILTPSSTSSRYELQKLYLKIKSSFSFLPIFVWCCYLLENSLEGFFQCRFTLQCNRFSFFVVFQIVSVFHTHWWRLFSIGHRILSWCFLSHILKVLYFLSLLFLVLSIDCFSFAHKLFPPVWMILKFQ